MSNKMTTTIIIKSPPFGRIDGKEGVDLALVCAAFEHIVNLVFVNEGVFHLLVNQNEEYIDDKLHDIQLKALAFYEIEKIHVESESLLRFGLPQDNLLQDVNLLSATEINSMCAESQHTVTF